MNTRAKLYTIGFTKKNAKEFFEKLMENNVKVVIDIRLNNVSQLAGYTKKEDLKYFLEKICKINYLHITDLAPKNELLKRYRKNEIAWKEFEQLFKQLLIERRPERNISVEQLDSACLLCSESTATKCHRRIVAEYFKDIYDNIDIFHI